MCSECATFSFALIFAIIACLWLPLLFHGLEKRSSFLHASTCLQFPLLFGSLSRWYPGPAFNRKWPLPFYSVNRRVVYCCQLRRPLCSHTLLHDHQSHFQRPHCWVSIVDQDYLFQDFQNVKASLNTLTVG